MEKHELGLWRELISFPDEKWASISGHVEKAYAETTVYPPGGCVPPVTGLGD